MSAFAIIEGHQAPETNFRFPHLVSSVAIYPNQTLAKERRTLGTDGRLADLAAGSWQPKPSRLAGNITDL